MKKYYSPHVLLFLVISFLCNVAIICKAQTPQTFPGWAWAKNNTSGNNNSGSYVTSDIMGNVYVVGYFGGDSMAFDNIILKNADTSGSTTDIFLVKYNTKGNVLWAKKAGGVDDDWAFSLATDSFGNIYVTGGFSSPSINFDTFKLNNNGNENIYLTKYDTYGNVLWAKSAGGIYTDNANSVTVDISGYIYLAGGFSSASIVFDNVILNNTDSGYLDIFLTKYDANGKVIWAKNAGGNQDDWATNVATDSSGNVYIAGTVFSSSITFGTKVLSNNYPDYNIFLAKYNTNGNALWAKSSTGAWTAAMSSMTTDISGNVYVAAQFESTTEYLYGAKITFDTITATAPDSISLLSMVLVKYDSGGNVLWAKGIGGEGDDIPSSVATDISGNVYLTGGCQSPTITFDTLILYNLSNLYMILVKYNTQGDLLWVTTDPVSGGAICTDLFGNVYFTSYFDTSSITFGNTTLINTDTGISDNMYIAKIGTATGIINVIPNKDNIKIYPNPTTGLFTLVLPVPNAQVTVTDAIGREVMCTTAHNKTVQLDIKNNGMYFVRVQTNGETITRKLIVAK